MIGARKIAVTIAGSLLVLLAGCATTHSNLSGSADKLERDAAMLARDASNDYSRAARDFADQAHDFRRTVDDSKADDDDVEDAFEELARDYHSLRDEIDRADSDRAEDDLKPVTESYLDIEREMGPDGDRYASDSDRRDRY